MKNESNEIRKNNTQFNYFIGNISENNSNYTKSFFSSNKSINTFFNKNKQKKNSSKSINIFSDSSNSKILSKNHNSINSCKNNDYYNNYISKTLFYSNEQNQKIKKFFDKTKSSKKISSLFSTLNFRSNVNKIARATYSDKRVNNGFITNKIKNGLNKNYADISNFNKIYVKQKNKKKGGKPISLIINNSVFLKNQQGLKYSPTKNINKNFVNKSINFDKNSKIFKNIKNQSNGEQINSSNKVYNKMIIGAVNMGKKLNTNKTKKLLTLSNSYVVKDKVKPNKISNNVNKFGKFSNRSTCFNYK